MTELLGKGGTIFFLLNDKEKNQFEIICFPICKCKQAHLHNISCLKLIVTTLNTILRQIIDTIPHYHHFRFFISFFILHDLLTLTILCESFSNIFHQLAFWDPFIIHLFGMEWTKGVHHSQKTMYLLFSELLLSPHYIKEWPYRMILRFCNVSLLQKLKMYWSTVMIFLSEITVEFICSWIHFPENILNNDWFWWLLLY